MDKETERAIVQKAIRLLPKPKGYSNHLTRVAVEHQGTTYFVNFHKITKGKKKYWQLDRNNSITN